MLAFRLAWKFSWTSREMMNETTSAQTNKWKWITQFIDSGSKWQHARAIWLVQLLFWTLPAKVAQPAQCYPYGFMHTNDTIVWLKYNSHREYNIEDNELQAKSNKPVHTNFPLPNCIDFHYYIFREHASPQTCVFVHVLAYPSGPAFMRESSPRNTWLLKISVHKWFSWWSPKLRFKIKLLVRMLSLIFSAAIPSYYLHP